MFRTQVARKAAALALAIALAAGCSAAESGAGPGGDDVVEIRLTAANRFSPADITVDPGTTVRWINDANMLHTVTPDNPNQPGVWAAAQRGTPGTVLTHTFTVAGQSYPYHCDPHLADGMVGIVRVR
jgi:plastocyanin